MSKMIKRILTMAVALAMLVGYLPGITLPTRATDAEHTLETGVEGLSAEWTDFVATTTNTNKTDPVPNWSASVKTIEASVTIEKATATNPGYTTLILTNNLTQEAILSFNWEYSAQRSGSILTIDETQMSAGTSGSTISGTEEFTLPSGDSVTITLTVPSTTAKNTENLTFKLFELNLYVDEQVTTTFKAVDPAQGSYTVNGVAITADTDLTQGAAVAYELAATPAEGYVFSGWYSETDQTFLSTSTTASVKLSTNQTVYPMFIKAEDAIWGVGGASFTDLDDAFYCAERSEDKVVTLLQDYILTESVTVPKGITMLIPFDEDRTCYLETPQALPRIDADGDGNLDDTLRPWVAPYAYRTLTLASGVTVTVEGGLSVSAMHHGGGQATAGAPYGPCGFILTESGSQISVADGGALYVWGYIVGSGTVEALSGAAVYENIQFTDFRGGSASSSFLPKESQTAEEQAKRVVFPFNQYYVQNIEIPLTIYQGAKEIVYVSVFAANDNNSTAIDFIGTDKSMFRMESGASITKRYDGSTDRLVVEVNGNISINGMTVVMEGFTGEEGVSSAMFNLPITNNITININSGITEINQNIALQAGAVVNIAKEACMYITEGWNIYVYDRDEWLSGKFVHANVNVRPIAWSYVNGTTVVRGNDSLVDAKINVNGTLEVEGYIYTTAGGANICSSEGTGKVILWCGNGDATETWQTTQSGTEITFVSIPLTAVQLKNGTNAATEYTSTEDADPDYGAAYFFDSTTGTWYDAVAVKFDGNGATSGSVESQEILNIDIVGEYNDIELPECGFARPGFNFVEWNTEADGTGTGYQPGDTFAVTENVTLYAIWEAKIFNVYVDGVESGELIYGADLKGWIANLEEPTKSGHNFAGWVVKDADGNVYTGDTMPAYDVYITASWTEIKKVTYTYLDKDGQELKTEEVEDGAAPSYPEVPATIDSTYYTYTFDKWTKEEDADGNVTFTATYTATAKTFNVTYYNGTDVFTEDQANEYNDWTITVTAAVPAKDGYNFKGWATTEGGEVAYEAGDEIALTADLTLYAVWECLHANATVTYANDGETHSVTETCSCGYSKTTTGVAHVYNETTHACVCGAENHVHDRYEVVGDIHQSFCSCSKLLGEGEHTYIFDEAGLTCTCVCGAGYNGIYTAETGIYWIENGVAVADKGLVRVVESGEAYYYYFVGYTAVTNGVYWVENNNDLLPKWDYTFGADGIIGYDDALNNSETQNHQIVTYDGVKYYTIDGIKVHYGLFEMDGGYYYARRDGSLVCGKTYWITDTHGLMEEGSYTFDEEGRMIMDGIVNGYYYVNGVRTYAGLIKIDGSYYYVRTNGAVATGTYWITKTNGLMPQGSYEFDDDGKMLNAPAEVPEVEEAFTGIKDGYYYENGKLTYAGLIVIDGKYYYVRTGGQVATGRYWITKTNGLMEAGNYYFDETGAMILE